MTNDFCRFLSNGYRFKSDGTNLVYQPCCWFKREIPIINNPTFDQEKAAISRIQTWTPDCAACQQIEATDAYGDRSPRLRSFREIPDGSVPANVPVWIELTIDTTCNAACIMCGPWHSTTWRKQEIKFNVKKIEDQPDIVDATTWLKLIMEKFPFDYVRSVSFLGGEPFESPVPLIVMKTLKQLRGSLKDVTIHFQTNGSIKPDPKIMELAADCKLVKFNLSIDAVGTRLEYQRYPILWHKIESTVDYVKRLALPNLRFVSLATLTPLTIYYYDEVESWVNNTFNAQDASLLKPNKSIGRVDIAHTPPKLREAVRLKFGPDHIVTKLISNVNYRPTYECIHYLDWLDGQRKTNWRTTFPEIVKYLDHVQ